MGAAVSGEGASALREWAGIPRRLRRAISGLSASDLRRRGGSEGLSIREYVHHLVEANIVASTIALAALGKPGCTFDWSWMYPDSRWVKGLGYGRAPLEPALRLFEALCSHIAGLARRAPGGMSRSVRLVDSAGARPRRRTLEQVLAEECEHARHHLRDIAKAKKE
jgi:hypothetical protein